MPPLQNSNLVLTAETRTKESAEPSGEPDTLWGRMAGKKMGDRVRKGRPEELEQRKAKAKKCVATLRGLLPRPTLIGLFPRPTLSLHQAPLRYTNSLASISFGERLS